MPSLFLRYLGKGQLQCWLSNRYQWISRAVPNTARPALFLKTMLEFALLNFNSPVAIRYPRGQAYDGLEEYNAPIRYGKAEMIIEESDIALVAAGNMLITAQAVREKLKEKGYNITIVNERFIKPVGQIIRVSQTYSYYGRKCFVRWLW